jgi:hypothetical protein
MTDPIQQSQILLTSIERTATPDFQLDQSGDYGPLTNHQRFRGAHILLDVTAINTTPSVVVTIDGYDFGSSSWYNIGTGLAVTTAVFNIYHVHPDLTAVANLVFKDGLPYLWRVILTHADAEGITYTLAVNYLD